jgi:hypothetical protein
MRRPRARLLACAAVWLLLPASAGAGLRGAFDPITNLSQITNGFEQPALRPLPAADGLERFFAFSTRSQVLGYESSREIWLHVNATLAGNGLSGNDLKTVRVPLLRDPTGHVSYTDPAWSPDGRFLAYVVTDRYAATASIYVQEFQVSDDLAEAATPVGGPILVVSGTGDESHNRRPAWSPDETTLAFDSDRSGGAIAIYTAQVFPTVGPPVLLTNDPAHAQMSPSYSRDGTRLVYTSNAFGPPQIFILDLTTPFPHTATMAERHFLITPRHTPRWSSDGKAIYYDASAADDPEKVGDIFRVDLATGERCAIYVDQTADWGVDVSSYEHRTPEGILYNYFLFTSMAAANFFPLGPHIWRAEYVQNCLPPLPMAVSISPSTFNAGSSGQDVVVTLSFPAQTKAAGYQCQSFDGPLEGVKMRVALLPSPTLDGLAATGDKQQIRLSGGAVTPQFRDYTVSGDPHIDVRWSRTDVQSFLESQGLVNRVVALPVAAYSNDVGRPFLGIGYMKLSTSSLTSELDRGAAGGGPATLAAAPNPFNPETTLRFRTSAPGGVGLRVFDIRGALVRTLVRQWLPEGDHTAVWDGRTDGGGEAPSGLYFAQLQSGHGPATRLKLILMK